MSLNLFGTFPALVTPMKDGEVDEDALRALVSRVIEGGVAGLVPCGTTGESLLDFESIRAQMEVPCRVRARPQRCCGTRSR